MDDGTRTEELELLGRLEELFLPHAAWRGLAMAQAWAVQKALTPLPEEDIKTWSSCFAALALCDGASIAEAKREARRVRDLLRRPEPPTVDEVQASARDVLRLETRALVRDWLAALEAAGRASGGRIRRDDLDARMLPTLPDDARAAFEGACAGRMLGLEGARDVLLLETMSLEDPELRLPHDAVAWLRLRGIEVVD